MKWDLQAFCDYRSSDINNSYNSQDFENGLDDRKREDKKSSNQKVEYD